MASQLFKSLYNPINEDRYIDTPKTRLLEQSPKETRDYETQRILNSIMAVENGRREMIKEKHRGIVLEEPVLLLSSTDGLVSLTVEYIPGKRRQSEIERLRFRLDFLSQNPEDKREYEMLKKAMSPNTLRTCNEGLFHW